MTVTAFPIIIRNLPGMVSRLLVGVKVISRRVTNGYVYHDQCLREKVTEKTKEAGACAQSGPSSRNIER